ncbi:hypothetical protein MTR67_053344 [Solanum verrucosum]|uniref:Phospholipase/carboxylesterase/thioesterase domain-containing protein n=1 Tax=Solanum verrucosum TaxID=315347 RepID=A0AAF1A469_SOLVR|nr:hypothetical protein MTR67_053344 [Solanum verrucosum]
MIDISDSGQDGSGHRGGQDAGREVEMVQTCVWKCASIPMRRCERLVITASFSYLLEVRVYRKQPPCPHKVGVHTTLTRPHCGALVGDDVVPYNYGEKSSQKLRSCGFQDVAFKSYTSLGHYTIPEEMDEVCGWLTSKLGLEGKS